jgi:hypothetical protein
MLIPQATAAIARHDPVSVTSVSLGTKAACVLSGAVGTLVLQGASDPVVERTAIGILGLLILGGLPIIVKAIWDNTKATTGNAMAVQVSTEAFRALTTEIRESGRSYTDARVQAVGEIRADIASGVAQVKERIDVATDKVLTVIEHNNDNKKGGTAA